MNEGWHLDEMLNLCVDCVFDDRAMFASSSDDEQYDNDDVFNVASANMGDCPPNYRQCFLFQWKSAVEMLCSNLRDNVLLLLDPVDKTQSNGVRRC